MSYNYGGGTSPFVLLGVTLFIIALAYFVIIRNPNFLKNLGKSGKIRAAVGKTVSGPNVYPVVGPIITVERTDCNTTGCGDGGDSYRDNVGFPCRYLVLVGHRLDLRRCSSIGGMRYISSVRGTMRQQEQRCKIGEY